MSALRQTPEPGRRIIAHRGDAMEFTLTAPAGSHGTAWLRTNIGKAGIRRKEIIQHVEKKTPILARDWHDVPLRPGGDGVFALRVPLIEIGCFEAKTFFIPDNSSEPQWP